MGRIAVAAIVSLWLIPISISVNRIVPHPYMDEIFHVPQVQQYCRGNFTTWDPMITTPPGLYFLSLSYVASLFPGLFCLQAVTSFYDSCSTSILRLTNCVLGLICSILFYEIISHLRPSLDDKKVTLQAVILSLYPLHWFFHFLYYTDVASVTAVIAMYFFNLKKKYLQSSLIGAFSVLIRQTNIVWMLFVACAGVIGFTDSSKRDFGEFEEFRESEEKYRQSANLKGTLKASNLRRRKFNAGVDSPNSVQLQASVPIACSPGLIDEIQDILTISWHFLGELLSLFVPFIVIFIAFVAFVYWNGSIVLGAKDAHIVSPHFAQLLYFGIASAAFMFPVHFSVSQAAAMFKKTFANKLLTSQWILTLTFAILAVKYFSIAHPYLLADNRHYPFYLWLKVINSHWLSKYLIVPLYIYSWFSIFSNLAKTQKKIWMLAYFLACAATLIPAPLIEFRYYTIPFFFLILHTEIDNFKSWLLMGGLYLIINGFTMFMFLFRPFSWNHEAGVQRFIW